MDAELILRQAQDKNTPPEILTELAHNQDREIRRCVATNPHTPAKTLTELCIEFPDEVVENSVCNFFLRWENKESKSIILSLIRSSQVSADKLAKLANHGNLEISEAIINNPITSGNTIDKIFDRNGLRLRGKMFIFANNKNTKDITLEKVAINFQPGSNNLYDVYNLISEHPNVSANTIELLDLKRGSVNIGNDKLKNFSNHENLKVRRLVARHPNTPTEVLTKLSLEDDFYIKTSVARHRNTAKNIICDWAEYENDRIRHLIAAREDMSIDIATSLLRDTFSDVVEKIADNPNTPKAIVDDLVEYPVVQVRVAVAGRKDLLLKNAIILAHDVSVPVIKKLASNPNLPVELKNFLSILQNNRIHRFCMGRYFNPRSIQEYLKELSTISIPEQVATEMTVINSIFVKRLLASNPNISINIFRILSMDSEIGVLIGLTNNVNTPPEILAKIAETTNHLVRQGVAEHPQVTAEILDELKSDRNINVREKVAKSSKISLEAIEYLANDAIPLVRREIAKNPQTPTNILDKLKSDRSLSVRLAIAENSHTSINTLKELSQDEAFKIAKSARANIKGSAED